MASSHPAETQFLRASIRASVERGDALAVFFPFSAREYDGTPGFTEIPAGAFRSEPDPPQPVTADPETLDTETDGNYGDAVLTHPVDSDRRPAQTLDGGENHGASWSESDRLAFLARVQRIDPRERRP